MASANNSTPLSRVMALVVKESRQILRDPSSIILGVVMPVMLIVLFGYALSTLPLIQAGLGFFAALSVVFAADLSIVVMEVTDNLVMALIPGAMDAGLVDPIFWIGMIIALTVAFIAAFPVNRYLIDKGKGHALTHQFHQDHHDHDGAPPSAPDDDNHHHDHG